MKKIISLSICVFLLMTVFSVCSFAEPVELEFFVQQSMYFDTFQEIANRFNAENPDIKITATNAPSPEEVLQTRVINNDVPDLISSWSSAADFKQYAADGNFLDLTGEEFLNTVDQGYLESLKIDGKDYSLPLYYCTVGIYYNIDLFNQCGLKAPETYDELINACKVLKENGITPLTFTDAEDWSHGKLNMPLYSNYIDNYQQFFADLQSGAAKAADNPQYRECADIILELRQYAPEDTISIDYNTGLYQFAFGDVAMAINGTWYAAQVRGANPDINFEMIPFPAKEAGKAEVSITVDASLSISAKIGEKKEAALKFLEFFSRVENAQYVSDTASSPCLVKGTSFSDTALAKVIDCYNEGKVNPWPQDLWPVSTVNNNYKLVMEFVASHDYDKFLSGTDEIFFGAK